MHSVFGWGLRIVFAIAVALGLGGCRTIEGATRLASMSDEEFVTYKTHAARRVGMAVDAAIAEGDLTVEAVMKVATALEGLAAGTAMPAGAALTDELDLTGYGALAIAFALDQLDELLQSDGGYQLGWQRGKVTLEAVAAEIKLRALG